MGLGLFVNLLTAVVMLLTSALAFPAPDANSLLFFTRASGDEKTIAENAGFNVVQLDDSQWPALTAADISTYKAIVFGDSRCTGSYASLLGVPEANRAAWSEAVTGNIIVLGTDPSYHYVDDDVGAGILMNSSIHFAAGVPGKTGLYMSLSCYFGGMDEFTLPILDQFGNIRVRGDPRCSDDVHMVADHPALTGLTDALLSNWVCSVHELLTDYPTDWAPLAIARNALGSGERTFSDGSRGVPFIIARGVKVPACGNGRIDSGEECDDGNTADGDGCSSVCRIEPKAPDTCELCSPHPGKNLCHPTTSCSTTPFGTMCACRPGYRAESGGVDTQWRLEWSMKGHENRVYVKPGTPCSALCDAYFLGAKSCAEVEEAKCVKK